MPAKKRTVKQTIAPKTDSSANITPTNTSSEKVTQPKMNFTLNSVVTYFWETLYGQVCHTWNDLPVDLQTTILPAVGITKMSESAVHELFEIRNQNNKELFIQKLQVISNSKENAAS